MSKIIALDMDNKPLGQFEGVPDALTWSLNGHPNVSGGGLTTVSIPAESAMQEWLGFGRMVIVAPDDLPIYVGMIDTPWVANLPAKLTVYDPEYFLNIRIAESAPVKFTGDMENIMRQVIEAANYSEDICLRLGTVDDISRIYREETFDGKSLWEQLKTLLLRSGTEMKFRAEQEDDDRWYIYVDIARTMGIETQFLISDGDRGNMTINSATVRGEIYNRMIGISSANSASSRLQTRPIYDQASRERYRTRSKVVQFRDITDLATLETNVQAVLDAAKEPYLEMTVHVANISHSFLKFRLGNRLIAHASDIYLPYGVRGWQGTARITKMSYIERQNSLLMTIIGAL